MEAIDGSILLSIGFIHLLALISPGPDFLIIVKNSLSQTRKTGVYISIGLALGILFHAAYTLLGIGLILTHNLILFKSIQILGGL